MIINKITPSVNLILSLTTTILYQQLYKDYPKILSPSMICVCKIWVIPSIYNLQSNVFSLHWANKKLQLHYFQQHQFCIFSLRFSSDSKEILGGANDGRIYVYDRETNQQVRDLLTLDGL